MSDTSASAQPSHLTRRLFAASSASALWSLARAESATERGKTVVAEAITALGGKTFQAMRDRVETGRSYSFYREKLSGLSVAKVSTLYPDRNANGRLQLPVERQVLGKKGEVSVLFNDKGGWEITFRGARPLPQLTVDRRRDYALHNVFTILLSRLDEPGLAITSQGSAVYANQPVEKVEFFDSEGRSVVVFFHSSTKLPVQQLFYRRDPETKQRIPEVAYYAKYRNVNGIQWPYHVLREREGEKVFESFAETVQINVGVEPSLFELPRDAKELPASL